MQAIYFKGTVIALSTADKHTRILIKQHCSEQVQPSDIVDLLVSGQTYKLKDNYQTKPIYLNQIF